MHPNNYQADKQDRLAYLRNGPLYSRIGSRAAILKSEENFEIRKMDLEFFQNSLKKISKESANIPQKPNTNHHINNLSTVNNHLL